MQQTELRWSQPSVFGQDISLSTGQSFQRGSYFCSCTFRASFPPELFRINDSFSSYIQQENIYNINNNYIYTHTNVWLSNICHLQGFYGCTFTLFCLSHSLMSPYKASHGLQLLDNLNFFCSEWRRVCLAKTLIFMCFRRSSVDRLEGVMEMNLWRLQVDVPSPASTAHLQPLWVHASWLLWLGVMFSSLRF